MLLNNRVLWKDSGTVRDLSVELNDLFAGTKVIPFVAGTDKLYVGSDLPFNHRHFQFSVLNTTPSKPSVEIWNGNAWEPAVDVLDMTAGFTKSGIIQWTLDRNRSWGSDDTSENVDDLETFKIYGLYWVRISFDANFSAGTALKYVGHKFSTDAQLAGQWPDLGRTAVRDAFNSGKADWDDQHILAAEEILVWLRKEKVISAPGQILGWEIFANAAVHKTAEIIFSSMGERKEEERALASKKFYQSVNSIVWPWIDRNADGALGNEERFVHRTFRRV